MRLIDADALKRDLIDNWAFYPVLLKNAIERQPTIDPESLRPKGRWVQEDYYPPYCSNCEGIAPMDCEGERFYHSDYCPNCGARMEG